VIDIKQLILAFGFGIGSISAIDVLGSITSRKWKYNYAYLTPLSFVVYTMLGYYTSQIATLNWTLLVGFMVGIYDGTIGWKLAIVLEANFGKFKEQNLKTNTVQRISFMILVSGVFGFAGVFLARFTL